MNELEAVRFTANILRTLANNAITGSLDWQCGFHAARMLDRYLEEGADTKEVDV